MNARQAHEENKAMEANLVVYAKEMAIRLGITNEAALDRKVAAYIKIAKGETAKAAWEIRGKNAAVLLAAEQQ